MSFLYFLPGHQGPLSLARVEQLGLRYAFEDKPPRSHEVAANGPNGGPGAVAVTRSAFGGDDSKLGYHADRQTWRQIPKLAEEVWVGFYTDEPPGPEDLARDELLDGYLLKLGDDNQWLVPVAREHAEGVTASAVTSSTRLPARLELDADGRLVPGAVIDEHATLDEAASRYFDAFLAAAEDSDDGVVRFEFDEMVTSAVTVLQANYRVALTEVVALGLLHYRGHHAKLILDAAVDLPGLYALQQKKTASATSNTGDGKSAGTQPTGPA